MALSETVSPEVGEDSGTAFVSDRISVATRGNGPDIVLVPGLAAHRDVWNDAAARLEHRYRLIVTDLRPQLGRIAAPMTVLFVVPPDAPIPPDEFERTLRSSFDGAPRTRLKRIEDSRHFIQIDQLARFVGEVEAFMDRP